MRTRRDRPQGRPPQHEFPVAEADQIGEIGLAAAELPDAQRPIGTFQTLQHRAADMFVALEQARSMSMFATMASDFDDAKERATAVAAAKVQIGKSGKFVGQQSIQLHGGIGMTQEARIGHYFKRLTMIENSFGDTDYHLRRVTNSGGLV